MKYIRQLGVILLFSFFGELCSAVIPFRLPAAIYGMVLLVAALLLKIIPFSWVKDTGSFLTGVLPLLFVSPVAGLMDHWAVIAPNAAGIMIILVVTTVLTFTVSGLTASFLMKWRGRYVGTSAK